MITSLQIISQPTLERVAARALADGTTLTIKRAGSQVWFQTETPSVRCNLGLFVLDDGSCQIVGQAYGRDDTDLGEWTETFAPEQNLLYLEAAAMLGEMEYESHAQSVCAGTADCPYCETHIKGNCDGPDNCRQCKEEAPE
jgi:hypothetical protein